MERKPEPEPLMQADDQVEAYARADFAAANALFCEQLEARAGGVLAGCALDLGCGPADIPIRLALRNPRLEVDAVDGSAPMLRWAERALRDAGLEGRVRLLQMEIGGAHSALPAAAFDYVLSNSLLHHLHDPAGLWREVARAVRPGGLVQIVDLTRPASRADAHAIVERYSGGEPEVLRRDFFASLCAAFEPDEVRAQLRAANLAWLEVESISDRHIAIHGRAPL